MRNPFKRGSENPWQRQDRQDQSKVILTAVVFAITVITGIGLLVYALTRD